MNKIGHDITQQELDEIMAEHDLEKNDVISFYEFKALLLDLDDVQSAKNIDLREAGLSWSCMRKVKKTFKYFCMLKNNILLMR